MKTPLVSVVIVSHSRPKELRQVLMSLCSQTLSEIEIIVVDNKSGASPEIEMVVNEFNGCRLLQNNENAGFARAINQGMRAAAGEYIYLSVDDVVLDRECLERFLNFKRMHSEVGLLSGVLYYARDPQTIECAGGKLNLGQFYQLTLNHFAERDIGQMCEPFEVTFILGGIIFAQRKFLMDIGGFREDFFMYFEDSELSIRVKRLGYSLMVLPQAKLYDLIAPNNFQASFVEPQKVANLLAVYLLHAQAWLLPIVYFRFLFSHCRDILKTGGVKSALYKKAWGTFLYAIPRLISDRWRFNRLIEKMSFHEDAKINTLPISAQNHLTLGKTNL